MFNAPNHPNFNNVATSITFAGLGNNTPTNLPTALGGGGGHLGFGSVAGSGERIIQLGANCCWANGSS